MTNKTVIITGYSCNNNCLFCIDSEKRNLPEKSTQQIICEIKDAKRRGSNYLEIIGGEETLRPDFIKLIKIAKNIGFKDIVMATNGRLLSYPEFARKVVESGITSIIFSIHGHTASLHDSLTQVRGSLFQLLQGIENLKLLNFPSIGTNTTIVKQNYKYLPDIASKIYKLGIRNAEFIFVDPNYGGGKKNFNKLTPRISLSAPYIQKCLDIGRKSLSSHWCVRYVPLCYFFGYEDQISELYEVRNFKTEHLAPDFINLDVEGSRKAAGRIKTKKCIKCKKYEICEGIFINYYQHYGDKELRPIR